MGSIPQKHMGFLYVVLSGLFLFNPVIAFVDVLPDAVGYLLLCMGLSKLADLNDKIDESRKRFRVLLWISFGELLATYLIYGVMSARLGEMNEYERPVYVLLFSFVSLVLHWYFLIPAFRYLFAGINDLAERYGATALTDANGRHKNACERLSTLTAVFMILRSVFSVLPELSILTSFENDAGSRLFPFDWYRFIMLFRIACGLFATVISLIWLISLIKFFIRLLRQTQWLEDLA